VEVSSDMAPVLTRLSSGGGFGFGKITVAAAGGTITYTGYLVGTSDQPGATLQNASAAFDGDLGTAASISAGFGSVNRLATITFTPPTPIPATSFRYHGYTGDNPGTGYRVSVNGGSYFDLSQSAQVTWVDLTSSLTGGQLTSFSVQSFSRQSPYETGVSLFALEINGSQLIDS